MVNLTINNQTYTVDADPETPLLWVLRDSLGLMGTKYGCGIAQCGACTVHVDGAAVRACVLPVRAVEGKAVTTIEGLSPDGSHRVQQAWLAARRAAVRVLSGGHDYGGGSPAAPESAPN